MSTQSYTPEPDDGDALIPVIPMEDPLVHMFTHPFCYNPTCPCHEDHDNITLVHGQYQEGLVTREEATAIVNGKTV